MAKFRDRAGREWAVSIDTLQFAAVRRQCGFELGKLLADGLRRLTELAEDPELLVGVLFALCEEQAARLGVTPEQFGRSMTSDSLAEGFDALTEAYADFCPSPKAQVLRALWAKTRTVGQAAVADLMGQVEAISTGTSSGSAGSSPGSPTSTPDA